MAQNIVKFTTGNQYIDLFTKHCKNNNDIADVIKGISVVNANLLSSVAIKEPSEIKDDVKKAIINAYYHIVAFIDTPKKEQRLLENWFGNYPLLFRMAWTFEEEKFYKTFTNLSKYNQKIVTEIVDNIWKLRSNRDISIVYGENSKRLSVPKIIKKQHLDTYYETLKNTIALAFTDSGAILVNYGEKNDCRIICGLRTDSDGVCKLDAASMERCYCTAPDGSYLAPPDGCTFVDWQFS